MKRTYPLIIAFVLLSAVLIVGCASSPYGWEGKFYNFQTNWVTNVVAKTEITYRTNTVEREVLTTNWLAGVPQILLQPVKESTVTSAPVVTYQTNINAEITYSVNTNTTALAQTAGTLINTFAPGVGSLATSGLLGLAALYGAFRNRKLKKSNNVLATTSDVLAQGIEIYGEVVKATGETGAKLDRQVKAELSKHQAKAGVLVQVLEILDKTVDNSEAQKAAEAIRKLVG